VTTTPSTFKNTGRLSSGAANSESWIVFPFKDVLFVNVRRTQDTGDKISTSEKNGWCPRYTPISVLGRLPNVNDVGYVCVYVPTDASHANAADLLQRLVKVGERKSFSVTSVNIPDSSAECLATFGIEATRSNAFSTAQFKPLSVH
jgi:hypothetical protein